MVGRRSMTSHADSARRLDLYFASAKEKEEFVEWAKKAKSPVSPFLVSKLREIRESDAHGRSGRAAKELDEMRACMVALREDLACKTAKLDALQGSEERSQDLAFLEEAEEGERVWNARLIAVLVEHGPVHEGTLLSLVGIEGDLERCRAIARQLEALEGYGLVKHGPRGWSWRG
ncbi:MAG: hypothetical protein ACYDHX_08005 [Methanothrix sp.]